MASYNLNEILKKKAQSASESANSTMDLGDAARVKVLSPGMQVMKRFLRNRLAMFGMITLIVMFAFCFLGPLFYPYGQQEPFEKYASQSVYYAHATIRTDQFSEYVVDENVEVNGEVTRKMTTNIAKMESDGVDSMKVVSDDGSHYMINKLGEHIYLLSAKDMELVATYGNAAVYLGNINRLSGEMTFAETSPGDDFAAYAQSMIVGKEGEFTYNGNTYSYTSGANKTYDIYAMGGDGVKYYNMEADAEFETALSANLNADAQFMHNEMGYMVVANGEDAYEIYLTGEEKPALLYTIFSFDTHTPGEELSEEFKVASLLAAYTADSFEADGRSFTIAPSEDVIVVSDENGAPYVELTNFVVSRKDGTDNMEIDLKHALRAEALRLLEAGEMKGSVNFRLPQQNENGEYEYDEEGNLLYTDSELVITRKDTGEYEIHCNQVIYRIDTYARPSSTHILGTDGDGFDVFARIMYGGRISLMVGFIVVLLEIFLGIIMGGIAGYFGGWVDNLIMRLVDIFYCLPYMPIMIIIGTMMDAYRMDTYMRLVVMMAALGVMGWAGIARIVRGQILSLREQEFMTAAEATGLKVSRRIFRHLVPNVMPQLIVIATMGLGSVILTESTLSFLGLGVKHPLATWGTMINSVSTLTQLESYAYIWIPVGLLICLTVIAFNFVGDGLRDAFDPKAKR